MLLIIDIDFLYQIDCTTFHIFLSWDIRKENCFLKFSKVGRSVNVWLVGEVDNHVAIYGSRVAECFSAFQRRSCLFKYCSLWLIVLYDVVPIQWVSIQYCKYWGLGAVAPERQYPVSPMTARYTMSVVTSIFGRHFTFATMPYAVMCCTKQWYIEKPYST